MKFTIGTASSNLEFNEDMKLIKGALLYADEVEIVGMAEYAVFKYFPARLSKAKDMEGLITSFIPFLKSLDNDEAKALVAQLENLEIQIQPYLPLLRKNKRRTGKEIQAQLMMKKYEKYCKEMLEEALNKMTEVGSGSEIRDLIKQEVIAVYDYDFEAFDVNELTGGFFANLVGTMKHQTSFPLFDSICANVIGSVLDATPNCIKLSDMDKEILRHAGVASNIMMTLPMLEYAEISEIIDFKKEMKAPLDNFRSAIYGFAEKMSSLPWDNDFQYECLKLYETQVLPNVNEINELTGETNTLLNFGKRVLEDEEERKKIGYLGAGMAATITTGAGIAGAMNVLENLIRFGAKIGLTSAGIAAFLKTADLLNKAASDSKEAKKKINNNVMYYYYMAQKRF